MIKIKVKPEDFIVDEVADIPLNAQGNSCIFFLKKRGWNTVDVIKRLSKKFHIPFSAFSYGGKKDKYALTTQYITIAQQYCNQSPSNSTSLPKGFISSKVEEDAYSISFVGLSGQPMRPAYIKGNRFSIIIRNLTEDNLRLALSEIDNVKKDGYPNYFDDQRFGSFDSRQGFVAEKILQKHYNGALKIYFSRIHPEDSKEKKEHKKFLYENWGNWEVCVKGAISEFERDAFKYLEKHPTGFVPILQRISHEEMVLFFSAYQSHLWNELLRKIIQSVDRNILKISQGIAGDYLFYAHVDDKNKEYLKRLVIPMPASNIRMPDTFTEALYSEVLKDNKIKASMFNIRKLRQAFFKGIERRATVIPENLSVDYSEDEIYHGKKKLTLEFFLPRGCYGTMFIKRLFSLNR